MDASRVGEQKAARSRRSVPERGDRIERLPPKAGIRVRGVVQYVDELQILVKWDDGRSESLRPGVHDFRIISDE